MNVQKRQKPITLAGLILPCKWDEAGKVLDTKISTFDEVEYMILNNHTGKRLLAHLRQKVVLKGYPIQKDGETFIQVAGFSIKGD